MTSTESSRSLQEYGAPASPPSSNNTPDEGEKALDGFLDEVAGLYQIIAVIALGLANAADSSELMVISFIMDEFGFSDTLQGILSGSMFAGMIVGGMFSGIIAYRIGRRPVLLYAMALNLVFGLAIAIFPHSWEWIFFCRVMAGVGVGGTVPVMFTMAAELVGPLHRGKFITVVCSFWMVGGIWTAGSCWILLGHYKVFWIYAAFASQVPNAVAMLLIFALLDETPKYFYTHGNITKANVVLKKMAKRNGKAFVDPFLINNEDANTINDDEVSGEQEGLLPEREKRGDQQQHLQNGVHLLPAVQHPPSWNPFVGASDMFQSHLWLVSVALLVTWFTLSFGWYGIILWIPRLFKDYNAGFGSYSEAFMVQGANLPGNILSTLLVDLVGRNRLLSGSMVISCFICVGMGFMTSLTPIVIGACFYNGISIIGWNCLSCVSAEMYPTYLRSSAMGIFNAVGKLASGLSQVAFGLMFHYNASPSLILFSGATMMMIGAFSTFYLDHAIRKERKQGIVHDVV